MQSLLNPRNLFHISSSDLDIQEGQHVQTSDFFKFAFLIQTHTRKWLQWLKVTPPWQVLGYDSMPDLGEIEVYQRADFQSGSRVLKKVF